MAAASIGADDRSMQPTLDHTRPDPSRTGALWVAATGAFLLFAAAVVFVAVRWNDIPDGAKLAALATVTAVLLVAGRTARASLPSTATALFHLGCFLLPVNVAAAMVRTPASPAWVLTVTGGVAALGLGLGARLERSVVLAAGAAAATVVLAAGVGDLAGPPQLATVLPAFVLTAWLAVGAERAARREGVIADALVCAAVAGTIVIPVVAALSIAGDTPAVVVLGGLTATAWVLGVALDRTQSASFPPLGVAPRVASLAILVPAVVVLSSGQAALLAGAIVLAAATEALRLDQPPLALIAGVAAPVTAVFGALAIGLSPDEAGLAAAVAAAVPLGLAGVVGERWRPAFVFSTLALAAPRLVLAFGEPSTAATALLVVGGLLIAVGLTAGQPALCVPGGVVAAFGYWMHLDLAGVDAADAYVLPVAIALLLVGVDAHRRQAASSWFTFAPPALLLGGTALAERIDTSMGIHAVVAGGVGVVAVAAGGRWRLIGPLVTGTALLVSLTVYETLAVTAGIPTWGWLALGGSSLLAAGLAMDHAETGPVEAGRRVVDVLGERFA